MFPHNTPVRLGGYFEADCLVSERRYRLTHYPLPPGRTFLLQTWTVVCAECARTA
jgi:hypothetical protein